MFIKDRDVVVAIQKLILFQRKDRYDTSITITNMLMIMTGCFDRSNARVRPHASGVCMRTRIAIRVPIHVGLIVRATRWRYTAMYRGAFETFVASGGGGTAVLIGKRNIERTVESLVCGSNWTPV